MGLRISLHVKKPLVRCFPYNFDNIYELLRDQTYASAVFDLVCTYTCVYNVSVLSIVLLKLYLSLVEDRVTMCAAKTGSSQIKTHKRLKMNAF